MVIVKPVLSSLLPPYFFDLHSSMVIVKLVKHKMATRSYQDLHSSMVIVKQSVERSEE